MANGTRPFPLLIALIVGAAVGWFIGQKPDSKPLASGPGNHLMKVGPAAANVGAAIQKNHMVFWKIRGPAKKLQIHFRVEDFKEAKGEPPFEGGLTPDGKEQLIECEGTGVCKSEAVNHKVIPLIPVDGLYYKYSQTLIGPDGKEETADAGIIIEK